MSSPPKPAATEAELRQADLIRAVADGAQQARSRAIDRLRRGRQERQRTEPLEEAAYSAGGESAEEEVRAGEVRAVVRAALDALAPEQREVIELAYYGGMSHSEIAAARGLPLGTVKTRTRLGMMRLREMLRPVYEGI